VEVVAYNILIWCRSSKKTDKIKWRRGSQLLLFARQHDGDSINDEMDVEQHLRNWWVIQNLTRKVWREEILTATGYYFKQTERESVA